MWLHMIYGGLVVMHQHAFLAKNSRNATNMEIK
jgi:hypothetical protein